MKALLYILVAVGLTGFAYWIYLRYEANNTVSTSTTPFKLSLTTANLVASKKVATLPSNLFKSLPSTTATSNTPTTTTTSGTTAKIGLVTIPINAKPISITPPPPPQPTTQQTLTAAIAAINNYQNVNENGGTIYTSYQSFTSYIANLTKVSLTYNAATKAIANLPVQTFWSIAAQERVMPWYPFDLWMLPNNAGYIAGLTLAAGYPKTVQSPPKKLHSNQDITVGAVYDNTGKQLAMVCLYPNVWNAPMNIG